MEDAFYCGHKLQDLSAERPRAATSSIATTKLCTNYSLVPQAASRLPLPHFLPVVVAEPSSSPPHTHNLPSTHPAAPQCVLAPGRLHALPQCVPNAFPSSVEPHRRRQMPQSEVSAPRSRPAHHNPS